MRKHRIVLVLLIAAIGVIVVALHQPSTPSATGAGNTAALVSARLVDDSL